MSTQFWWRSLLERDCLVDLRANAKAILKSILKKSDEMARTP